MDFDLTLEASQTLLDNTIKYLNNLPLALPSNAYIIKSYYASKSRILQSKGAVCLKESKNKPKSSCQQCCLNYKETKSSICVKSEKKKSKFARKLRKKIEICHKTLTKFQCKYTKKIDVTAENQLMIDCNFCNKVVLHNLKKPVKKKVTAPVSEFKVKKRNKKKKDKFCGLEKEAVVAAQQSVVKPKNRISNNPVTRRKALQAQKKSKNKLYKILTQTDMNPKPNKLANFLQSFNK